MSPQAVGLAAERQPGQPTPTLSTPDTVAAFTATLDGPRSTHPQETDPDPTDATRLRTERWSDADHSVTLVSVIAGGHTWPSAHVTLAGTETYGPVSHDLDASALAIAFLLDPSAT